ncbi:MAG: hypothetical protein JRI66_13035 [Deltaproteobacteria bacterium]|nr:hypothetical protein [Deltaproteobacteria bacterium]
MLKRILIAMAVMSLCFPLMVFGQEAYTPCEGNLIVNGDFEAGNTGFTSDYDYYNPPTITMYAPKTYVIGTDPNVYHKYWASFGDHTTGDGNMMIVNATCCTGGGEGCTEDCDNTPDDIVWEQTVTVEPGRTYIFSYYIALSYSANPPELEVSINGEPIGTYDALTDPPTPLGEWVLVSYPWYSGSATEATITIVDQRPMYSGDDYALDDITFCLTCDETAWGRSENYNTCFIKIPELATNKWGWTNGPLAASETSYVFDLWAAAGQCETDEGTLVGTVTVNYDGSTATVIYTVTEDDYHLTEAHLWVGDANLPENKKGDLTAAPGQFPFKPEIAPDGKSATISVPIDGDDNGIWVAAHAVVDGFECPEPLAP